MKKLRKFVTVMKILNNALEFEKYNSKNDETNIFLSNPLKNLHGKDISSQMEKFQSGERLLGMFDAY